MPFRSAFQDYDIADGTTLDLLKETDVECLRAGLSKQRCFSSALVDHLDNNNYMFENYHVFVSKHPMVSRSSSFVHHLASIV